VNEAQRRLRLERLFAAHASEVRAYARRRVDPAVADDITSEVFVVAWRRLEDVPDNALPWLLGCARRVLMHHHRRSRRDAALVALLEATHAGQVSDDLVLARALSELSDRDRELLLLIAWEGLKPAEAATVLDCSRSALAVRLHRARKRLAAALGRADQPAEVSDHRNIVQESAS
jgi:RNA polymerase sigma-70 factor, ECF subfamily